MLATAARRQFERLTLYKEEAVPMSTALTVAELARYQISEMRFGLAEVSPPVRISNRKRAGRILNPLPKGPEVRAHQNLRTDRHGAIRIVSISKVHCETLRHPSGPLLRKTPAHQISYAPRAAFTALPASELAYAIIAQARISAHRTPPGPACSTMEYIADKKAHTRARCIEATRAQGEIP
jgi:hypothetical protein